MVKSKISVGKCMCENKQKTYQKTAFLNTRVYMSQTALGPIYLVKAAPVGPTCVLYLRVTGKQVFSVYYIYTYSGVGPIGRALGLCGLWDCV